MAVAADEARCVSTGLSSSVVNHLADDGVASFELSHRSIFKACVTIISFEINPFSIHDKAKKSQRRANLELS